MTKRNASPITANPEASRLIAVAQAKCEGCRRSWRLDLRRKGGTYHGAPASCICTAQPERQALREIAARNRAKSQIMAVWIDDAPL